MGGPPLCRNLCDGFAVTRCCEATSRQARSGLRMVRKETSLRWVLICALATLGLASRLLGVLGAYESREGPWGPIFVTILIAAIWVVVVVIWRVPKPALTLAVAGGVYGALAIVLQQTMWSLFLDGPPEAAPPSGPILMISWISIIATNTIWGAFLGLLAAGMRRLLPWRPLRQRTG